MRDEAFRMMKDDYRRHDHGRIVGTLERTHREARIEEIDDEVTRAYNLYESCYNFGDRIRIKEITKEEAIEEMLKQYPGFKHSTYEDAVSYGLKISR